MYEVEKLEHNGCTITIYYDEYSEECNPRQYDNVGVMYIPPMRRYELGDKPFSHDVPDYARIVDVWNAVEHRGYDRSRFFRYLTMFCGTTVILPLWLLDHSGLAMNTGPFICDPAPHWDSGIVGWIFDTTKTRERVGVGLKDVEKFLSTEVSLYDAYLQGNVYGWTVTLPDGTEGDSCWGYLVADEDDRKYMLDDAKGSCRGE